MVADMLSTGEQHTNDRHNAEYTVAERIYLSMQLRAVTPDQNS